MTRRLTVRRNSPVRADAESMFVAESEVPGVSIGDLITLLSSDGSDARTGEVVERLDRSGEAFVRIELNEE